MAIFTPLITKALRGPAEVMLRPSGLRGVGSSGPSSFQSLFFGDGSDAISSSSGSTWSQGFMYGGVVAVGFAIGDFVGSWKNKRKKK